MDQFSQYQLKAAPTKDEHLVRKIDLDRKVAVGVEIKRLPNGRSNVRLLDATGRPSGKIIRNVIMLPVSPVMSPVTGIDELVARARRDNPLNHVVIE